MQTVMNNRPPVAKAGMLAELNTGGQRIVTRVAGVLLGAGRFVTRLSGDSDAEVNPPAAAADITGMRAQGFVVMQEMKMPVSGGEYAADEPVPVLRRGYIYAEIEGNVTEGDAVNVRYAGTGNAGACRAAAVTNETAILPNAKFAETTTGSPGFAKVEVNLPG